MSASLPDNPIASAEEDRFERIDFAQNIAGLIAGAPRGSTLRIGVYGGWGEGKTSILQLVDILLNEKGHVTVWLKPWAWSDDQSMGEMLIREIARVLGVDLNSIEGAERARAAGEKVREVAKVAGGAVNLPRFRGHPG
jgi:predicted KAP-like P-loop ATPase